MKLGLDELLIVNPGAAPGSARTGARLERSWFLGADGGVYRVGREATRGSATTLNETALGDAEPVPRYFLGDDGVLYETR